MTRGLLLGKFMPLTRGHEYLINFARAYCDDLTVMVCSRSFEPISGAMRYRWVCEAFPDVTVKHVVDDMLPQHPADVGDETEFRRVWVEQARQAAEGSIDYYFASEDYGHWMAQGLEAEYVPVDPQRLAYPVLATMVREAEIYGAWEMLPTVVRKDYVKRVAIVGPESTGKTTMARYLAKRLKTVCVPEYGRIYTEQFGVNGLTGEWSTKDLDRIVDGHRASEIASLINSGPIMVEDTDPIMTDIWCQMLIGTTPPVRTRKADRYLLLDIDLPFAQDGTRYYPDQRDRQRFFDLCLSTLEANGCKYEIVSGVGNERLEAGFEAALRVHL